VSSTEEVTQAEARMVAAGLPAEPEPGAICCYARQDKVWARDPDGVAWEYYTVLEHIERRHDHPAPLAITSRRPAPGHRACGGVS
jgi:hypothetical protein